MIQKRTLTLAEILVAVTVFSLLAVSLYSLLSTGIFVRKRLEDQELEFEGGYLNLERLAGELRGAVFFRETDSGFRGDNLQIEFYTIVFDWRNNIPQLFQVRYSFGQDKLKRIVRVPFSDEAPRQFDLIENVKSGLFYYFDAEGNELNTWTDQENFPQGVAIKVAYKDSRGKAPAIDKYVMILR